MLKITNSKVRDAYNLILENHSEEEAAKIILNSLSILGAKKIKIQTHLDEESFKRINKYKYPDRLALFLETTNSKSLEWKNNSFTKIALI